MFDIGDAVEWTPADTFERTAQARWGKTGWVVSGLPGVMRGGRLRGKNCVFLAVATPDGGVEPDSARWVPVERVRALSGPAEAERIRSLAADVLDETADKIDSMAAAAAEHPDLALKLKGISMGLDTAIRDLKGVV